MSKVVQKPDNDLLKQLLPFSGDLQEIPNTYQANLVVQVNYFTCGGMAISVCFRHLISDGAAAANFLKSWGEVARDANDIKNVIVDFTSIFRQYESIAVVKSVYEHQHVPFPSDQRVVKRFVLDGKKIASLRQKVGNGPHLNSPTRFETISALLLRAFMAINAAGKKDDEFRASQLAAVIPINLRNKTNPPLPQQCLGNLVQPTIANIPMDQNIDYNIIAGKVGESIKKMEKQYKKNLHEGEAAVEGCPKSRVFSISDWTRFPCYETDFGWGKPIWVATVALMDTGTVVLASSDGAGDEAWVALPKEEMAKFEQHPEILAHTNPLFMSKYSRL
ncbi:vinorine synthase-like [Melia azedarach]|uniref:Vinorine synthase-like n=1 Tax=Melia azedarach TaxID=155640 RepID=A0ACC1WPA8_MELAZ|nr:vinorine synthase-like [Melia azedarach]